MVTLALAKQHLEYEASDRDDLITQYINAARAWVENYTGKALSVGEVVDTVEAFGDYILLTRGPFVSLTSIAYTDTDDAAQTLTGARVQRGRVYPPSTGWPAIADYSNIVVTYQAGYATVPADLVSAQLLLIGHFFAHREAVTTGPAPVEVQFAVEALCRPYRAVMV